MSVSGITLTPVATEPVPRRENFFLSTATSTFYHVADGLTYPDALTAFSHAQTSSFTLSTAGVVQFFLTDQGFSDDRGGMSFSVNAVPIPSAVWLFGSGLIGLIGFARRKA